ncbi:Ankyrin repeat-containing domain [Pseudocohnilembus persalinus]|uniref:Ankyrin repeat-containing domain n=1 Tax=Pseudocohnilembus persalinus TaxID=266149 RepID=A0A0V0QD79_PSEPJ|nr:Ankyrin repeat-containing domain [Pseudocohnilembus persalinus]|eukprot:KRX00053.1 Ankyrin repeat-containing domain [Pseudocohnilembus persalinus]
MQSSQEKDNQPINSTVNKQQSSIRNAMYKSIYNNDIEQIKRITRLFDFDPHEEISSPGNKWCPIHYSCYLNKPQSLEYFIALSYRKYKNNFQDIINIQTKDGYTPVMIVALSNSIQSLQILFKYGGIDFSQKFDKNKTIFELIQKYSNDQFKEQFNILYAKNNCVEILPINSLDLEKFPALETLMDQENMQKELNISQKKQLKELLLNGQRNPCCICLSELGYIKYTICCGQPMHESCKPTEKQKCPLCSRQAFQLISEILYPERALIL